MARTVALCLKDLWACPSGGHIAGASVHVAPRGTPPPRVRLSVRVPLEYYLSRYMAAAQLVASLQGWQRHFWLGPPSHFFERSVTLANCCVYWGSHGCMLERGHEGPHRCDCADDPDYDRVTRLYPDGAMNVGTAPYYGPDTYFFGEDAA